MSQINKGKKRKENLLWKLDMLEASASRDVTNTRLVRTQFAAGKQLRKTKKKERRDQKSEDSYENPYRADLIAQEQQDQQEKEQGPVKISPEVQENIKALRVKLVEQKIHHYSKEIQRAIKKAKATEGLKIIKRIKKEEDYPDKVKKLQDEQLELKSIDVAQLTSVHVVRYMQKSFLPSKHHREDPPEFLPYSIVSPSDDSPSVVFYKTASPALLTVVARLCNTASVKTASESLVTAVKYAVKLAKKESAAELAKRKKKERKDKSKIENSELDDYDNYKGMNAASSDEESDEEADQSILGTTRLPEGNADNGNSEAEDGDDFFVFPDEDQASDTEGTENSSLKRKKEDKATSYVLPALASGYFSGGSDDEMEDVPRDRGYNLDNDTVVKEATTQRKNRRGQRARRQIFELKYGKNANHLKKERENKQAKWTQRQAEFEQREERRRQLGIERPQQKSLPDLPEKKNLHPSWEAKKKLSAAPVKFEGKKIVF